MTQMNTSQARVIEPTLSNVARGYKNAQLVGGALFPTVQVGLRAGRVIEFGKGAMQPLDTARAPGTNVKRFEPSYGSQNFSLIDHTLAAVVPIELMEEAKAGPGIDLSSVSVMEAVARMALEKELKQANLATNAGNYAGNSIALAGASQFSNPTSDPAGVVEDGRQAVRKKTGLTPNTAIISASVFAVLKRHPQIIDRVKFTGRDVPTAELLASFFEVDRVLIGGAIVANEVSGATSDVWGNNIVLAYTNTATVASMGAPSFGYTYQLRGYETVEPARWNADIRSWLHDVTDAYQPVIVGADAGYLITNAV